MAGFESYIPAHVLPVKLSELSVMHAYAGWGYHGICFCIC